MTWTIDGRQATGDEVATELAIAAARGERITSWSMPRNFPLWHLWRWPAYVRTYLVTWRFVMYLNELAEARKDGPKFKEEHDDDN